MESKSSRQREAIERIGQDLHRVTELVDSNGDVIQRIVTPLMVEFRWRDLAQIVVGACVLSIPMVFAEEVWILSEVLPTHKAVLVSLFSITFVALFVYLSFYRHEMKTNVGDFLLRIAATYFVTLLIAAFLLFAVDELPLMADTATAIKRIILVALPGCFSATVVDALK